MAFLIPAATALIRGLLKLTNHLGGTWDSPTVVGFTLADDGDADGNKIVNLADGADAGDAANIGQVNALFALRDAKQSVRVATAAALPAYTRTGNTITADANGSINGAGIDGVSSLLNGDAFLLKDGAAGADNGIYVFDDVGGGGTPWSATRRADADSDAEVTPGLLVGVDAGTTLQGHFFRLVCGPVTLNTTSLTFTDFTTALSFGSVYAIGGAKSDGENDTAARSDHQHGSSPQTDADALGDASHRWSPFTLTESKYGAQYLLGTVTKSQADSPYAIGSNDYLVRGNTSGGALQVDLPEASTVSGRVLEFKRMGGSNMTLTPNGVETIDGESSLVLDVDGAAVRIYSNGTSWDVMG